MFFGGGAALDDFWWLRLMPNKISVHTDNEALALIKDGGATIDEFIVVRGCCMWPKTENFNDESMGSIKSFSYKIAENVDLQQLLDQGHMQPVSGLGPRNCLRLLEMAEPDARDVDLGVDVWEAMAASIEDKPYTPPTSKAGPRNNIVQLDMNQKHESEDVLEKHREVRKGLVSLVRASCGT